MKIFHFSSVVLVLFSAEGFDSHVRNRLPEENMIDGALFQGQTSESNGDRLERCGTTIIESDVQAIQAATERPNFQRRKAQVVAVPPSSLPQPPKRKITVGTIIPVCFHVVGRRISRWQLQKNLAALNKAFSGASCCDPSQKWCVPGTCSPDTGIRFKMARLISGNISGTTESPSRLNACVKRNSTIIDMSSEKVEKEVKKEMHMGDGQILNVYFAMTKYLGNFTFKPDENSDDHYLDGVVVNREATVGGNNKKYNEGDELVHQVGYVSFLKNESTAASVNSNTIVSGIF